MDHYEIIDNKKVVLDENLTDTRDCDLCCLDESKCLTNGSRCYGQHEIYILYEEE